MERHLIILVLLSAILAAQAQTYMVISSQYIHAGENYSIVMRILEEIPKGESVALTARLVQNNKDRTQWAKVDGEATKDEQDVVLHLLVPQQIPPYSYILEVSGVGSKGFSELSFKNETYISVRRNSISILVQTDKPVYKPGDKVQYRIFGIFKSLEQVDMIIDVNIFDAKGNKLDEKNYVRAEPVFEGELPLSDLVNPGNWKIEVSPKVITIRKISKKKTVSKQNKITKRQGKCDKKKKEKKFSRCYNDLLDFIEKNTNAKVKEEPLTITDKTLIENAKKHHYFEVRDYVLPEFEVKVKTDKSYGVVFDEFLTGIVQAKYPTDMPVRGYAEITVSRQWYYGFHDPKAIRKSMMIIGEGSFKVEKDLLDRLTRCFKQTKYLRVHASVIETITGVKQEDTFNIIYYESPYKIEFHPGMPPTAKPELPYPIMIQVSYRDDSPLQEDDPKEVTLVRTYYTEQETSDTVENEMPCPDCTLVSPFSQGQTIMIKPETYLLDDEGMLYIENLVMPKAAATGTIKAQYGCDIVYKEISRFRSNTNVYLVVKAVDTGAVEVGKWMAFRVTSNVGPIEGGFIITAKEKLVKHGSFQINKHMTGSIVVQLTRNMAPSAKLVAYIVNEGELIADGLTLALKEIYENKVTCSFDPNGLVKPQSDIKLKMNADAHSYFFVLALDERVRLFKKGNDITRERVESALGRYGLLPVFYRRWGRYRPWTFAADDTWDMFNAAGSIVMTDLDVLQFYLQENQPVFDESGEEIAKPSLPRESQKAKSGAAESQPQGLTRKEFPEAWLWFSTYVGANGKASLKTVLPDSITKWTASCFAINPKTGLGVAAEFAEVTGFLDFYIRTDLSTSVIRGELVVVQANVFSYLPTEVKVLMTLFDTGEFEGIEMAEDGSTTTINGNLTRCVLVKPTQPTAVFFHIKPTSIGAIKIVARIDEASYNIFDQVIKYLTVKAEGEEMEKNIPILVSHKTYQVTSKSVTITYPSNLVQDSQRIQITLFGDIFGLSLKNLHRLIRQPYGCGEQTIIVYAPAVSAAAYLKATDRFTPALEDKITEILIKGYMRLMVFYRPDGSYSAFGTADPEGSTWLTGFAIKTIAQAATVVNLTKFDLEKFQTSVHYLLNQQKIDGDFNNTGRVIHTAMQGGLKGSAESLAAYVLNALKAVRDSGLLTDSQTMNDIESAIDRAESFLDNHNPATDYSAAIAAFAHTGNPAFLAFLKNSENKTTEGGLHWDQGWRKKPLAIEISAYVIRAYLQLDDIDNAMLVLEWFIKQRNHHGGFISTQDTVVGLEALATLAAAIFTKDVNMTVDVLAWRNGDMVGGKTFELTNVNFDVLQFVDVPGTVDGIDLTFTGKGVADIDIGLIFNVLVDPVEQSYNLSVTPFHESIKKYSLRVCTRYLIGNEESGMAMMKVSAISGYTPLKEGVVESSEYIKRVDTNRNILDIYFTEIPSTKICVDIKFQLLHSVSGVKQAPVKVYSYYKPRESAMVLYMPEILKGLNICDECGEECGCGPNDLVLSQDQCGVSK